MKEMLKYKNNINEGTLKNELPYDIISSIEQHKTSLGNNPAIPDIFEIPFLLKILNDYFIKIKEELKSIGYINVKSDNLKDAFSELLKKCIELETPNRNYLEKLVFNIISGLFGIPEDAIDFDLVLTETIELSNFSVKITSIEDYDDVSFDNIKEIKSLRKEILKRKMLKAVITGGAMCLSSNIKIYENEINKINPKLCHLYHIILLINNYLLLEQEFLNINDKHHQQLGVVEVSLGNDDELVRIKSHGVIFPILLCETIKGLFELFISHGLPEDINKAKYILEKSDFIKMEPWEMRIGPSLWEIISKSFNDIKTDELPYLLKKISKLDNDKFNFIMKEVLAKTKKGRHLMYIISNESKKDIEYDKFVDKIIKMKQDKGVITDNYIKSDEL